MGFGSTAANLSSRCSRSLSLRLPFRLGSLATVTRGLIMQKASGRVPKDAPTACGRTISGLFHSASSGSFRLSLAVLVRYRSPGSIQPWRVVPPASGGVPRAPPYSGSRHGWAEDFGYGALTPCGPPFQAVRLSSPLPRRRPRNPGEHAPRFGLLRFRSPLLAQCRLISSPAGTEMFHFPAYGFGGLCVHPPTTPH